jgi:hypothetical protein
MSRKTPWVGPGEGSTLQMLFLQDFPYGTGCWPSRKVRFELARKAGLAQISC